jgi:predicted RND superfamily exporter protein
MPLLRDDGWRVTGLALLGLLVATLLIGRSRRRTTYILVTIFIAVAATAALMVVLDWKIDFYNLLVFPVAFGIGVDGAIYVVWTVLARGGVFEWKHLSVSARAVFGSTMTTVVVFASLATSESGGLASLGKVGACSLLITLAANLVWLPAALSWHHHVKLDRRAPESKESEPQLQG